MLISGFINLVAESVVTMNELLAHIRKFVTVTDDDVTEINKYVVHKKLKKKEYLLKEGQVCTGNYFVIKGCLRMYFIQENGTEQIVQFAIENWWLTDHFSYDQQKPARFSIQAVEDSEVVVVEYKKSKALFEDVPALERYFRLISQKANGAAQQRLVFISSYSAEERYVNFNNAFPGFVQRVPQYMLASYLGFTPEFLSKIRAKKK